MTNEELRAKYARIPTDFSEIEMLKDQLLDSGLLEVAQADEANAGKMVGFDESGKMAAVEAGGDGTQLYQHYLAIGTSYPSVSLFVITNLTLDELDIDALFATSTKLVNVYATQGPDLLPVIMGSEQVDSEWVRKFYKINIDGTVSQILSKTTEGLQFYTHTADAL